MCGRYAIYGPISRRTRLGFLGLELEIEPHYNAAPTLMLPVYRLRRKGPELTPLRWGLIPSWAKNMMIGSKLINAKTETLTSKPSFRNAFERRRCLVPASGFYEWKNVAGRKHPYFIRPLNEEHFAFAGLWEWWPGNGDGSIESFTIITCEPNEMMAELHDRMPVILPPESYDAWLSPSHQDMAELQAMLAPYPADEMEAYPVSPRVNAAKDDDEQLITPLQ